MERREFLKYLAGAAALPGCGRFAPDANALEISDLQPRAAEVAINQVMWEAIDRFEATHAGTRIVPASGGGGGYGSPSERDPDAVHDDVREGYISEEAARASYPHAFEEGSTT